MPTYNVVKAQEEYAKQPYRDLWTWARIAEAQMRIDAPFLSRAVREREDPMKVGFCAILRDTLRLTRKQMFCFRGGHWQAIVLKIKAQKPDKDRIRLYLMAGGFLATVIGFLYGVHYLQG